MIYLISFSLIFNAFAKSEAIDSSLLRAYNSKVCNNEPSCYLADQQNLPKAKRTLQGRDCMCDFECVEFDDCCLDSEFYGASIKQKASRSYYCHPDYQVHMVVTCPSGYSDESVRKKCEDSVNDLHGDDSSVIRPATNIIKRITYGNAYCALCNDDLNVELWNITAGCGEAPADYFSTTTVKSSASSGGGGGGGGSSSSSSSTTEKARKFLPTREYSDGDAVNRRKEENTYTRKKTYESTQSSVYQIATPHKELLPPIVSSAEGANTETDARTFNVDLPAYSNSAGYTAKIKIPGFSEFNIEIKRLRRDSKPPSVDINLHSKDLDQILKYVRYDPHTGNFVSRYKNMDFICYFGATMPKDFNLYTRKCVPHLISECPPNTSAELAQRCASYTAIAYEEGSKKAFRNRDCAKCNAIKENKLTGCPQAIRAGASSLFSTSNKAVGAACSTPELKAKFC